MLDAYYAAVVDVLQRIAKEEGDSIHRAAELVAETIAADGLIYVIGAGHSAMVGEELFFRAGGLAPVYPFLNLEATLPHGARKATALEELPGYARAVLSRSGITPKDVLLIVSNSGVKTLPVEAALWAKEKGISTIAITSRAYSESLTPKNPYGVRLFEIADITVDNKVPSGDVLLRAEGIPVGLGPASTIAACFIANAIAVTAASILVERGMVPPVWASSHLPGSDAHNDAILARYLKRIPFL